MAGSGSVVGRRWLVAAGRGPPVAAAADGRSAKEQ